MVRFALLPFLLLVSCQMWRNGEAALPGAVEGTIYGVLQANYNPFDQTVVVVEDWAACEVLTQEGMRKDAPFHVLLRRVGDRWELVKRFDAPPSVETLTAAGPPRDVAGELLARLRFAISVVESSISNFLSASFNPFAQRITYEGEWAYARIGQLISTADAVAESWVLMRRVSGNWSTVKVFPERARFADFQASGVPRQEADALLRQIERGWSLGPAQVFNLLASRERPSRAHVFVEGRWGLVAFEAAGGGTRHGLLHLEEGNWVFKKEERALEEKDIIAAGAPASVARALRDGLVGEMDAAGP